MIGGAGSGSMTALRDAVDSLAEQISKKREEHMLDVLRYGTSIHSAAKVANPSVIFKRPVAAIVQTPRREGKSLWKTILDRYGWKTKSKGMARVDTYPTYTTAIDAAHQALTMAGHKATQPDPPDPLRSAYNHADPQRKVPVIRLDVSPAFYMNDVVEGALSNSIEAVCSGFGNSLAGRVGELAMAKYEPLGIYKPDMQPPSPDFWGSEIFDRNTLPLPANEDGSEWVLDVRFATGVYHVNGHDWLGVFVHGIANAMLPGQNSQADPLAQRRLLMPGSALELDYVIEHRGQVDPRSLYFDMFVPVEPEIVTDEWGWGSELEQLTIDKTKNAMLDPTADVSPPSYITNAWDRKSKHHKSAAQVAQAQALKEHRDYELSLRIQLATEQRERARRVLYKFSWKALMLAVIECKQLKVEAK
jgi:hypothetical protein